MDFQRYATLDSTLAEKWQLRGAMCLCQETGAAMLMSLDRVDVICKYDREIMDDTSCNVNIVKTVR